MAALFGTVAAQSAWAGEVPLPKAGHATNPTWSPDGARLAVEVNDMADRVDLFVVPVRAGQPGSPAAIALPGANAAFGSQKAVATTPAWHPEVLLLTGAVGGREFRLFFTPPNGGQASELLPRTQIDGALSFPAVSPDGSTVAFVTSTSGGGDVGVYRRASGKVDLVVRSSTTEAFPSFGRDGKRLFFTRRQTDREEIVSVPAGGGSETLVVTGAGSRTRPVEADGGKLVYFVKKSGEEDWALASCNASGGGEKILARQVALPERSAPALSPDGRWAFYGVTDPIAAQMIYAVEVSSGRVLPIPTRLVGAREPAVTEAGGATLLAFTALPSEGADWRGLHVVDISGKLN